MGKFFKFAVVTVAFVLVACWTRPLVFELRPFKAERLEITGTPSIPDKKPAVTAVGIDRRLLDSRESQIVLYERDPMAGSRFFSINGTPVQGRLQAYLDTAMEEQELTIFVNHPDGESCKWVEIPMPLFRSLTDQPTTP